MTPRLRGFSCNLAPGLRNINDDGALPKSNETAFHAPAANLVTTNQIKSESVAMSTASRQDEGGTQSQNPGGPICTQNHLWESLLDRVQFLGKNQGGFKMALEKFRVYTEDLDREFLRSLFDRYFESYNLFPREGVWRGTVERGLCVEVIVERPRSSGVVYNARESRSA